MIVVFFFERPQKYFEYDLRKCKVHFVWHVIMSYHKSTKARMRASHNNRHVEFDGRENLGQYSV